MLFRRQEGQFEIARCILKPKDLDSLFHAPMYGSTSSHIIIKYKIWNDSKSNQFRPSIHPPKIIFR